MKIILNRKDIYEGDLILVNAAHACRGRGAAMLAPLKGEDDMLLQRRAGNFLSQLMEAVEGEQDITVVSAWRSQKEQQLLWEESLKEHGAAFTEQYVALPGHSEHQTGLAIDLGRKEDPIDLIRPDFPYEGRCQQLREHAPEYGFVERYPAGKEAVTGIAHEPWHFRYVGVPHAGLMQEKGLTLEEYTDWIKQFAHGKNPYEIHQKHQSIQISYMPAEQADQREITVDAPYSVSGNNVDGFVITQWKRTEADAG